MYNKYSNAIVYHQKNIARTLLLLTIVHEMERYRFAVLINLVHSAT